MSSNHSAAGLCSTCDNAPGCMYFKQRGLQAVYCNEFTIEKIPSRFAGAYNSAAPSDGAPALETEVKGLCQTCGNNETCTFPRSPGGVWHCEEYTETAYADHA